MTDHDAERFVRIYVQHHWVGSKGGLDAFRRCARTHSVPQGRPVLTRLATEIAEDREALRAMMRRLGIGTVPAWQAVASFGETLGRFKPNGTLIRRSPMTDVIELDMLVTAVAAKKAGWLTLRRLAETDPRLDAAELDRLVERADAQRTELETLRPAAVDRLAG